MWVAAAGPAHARRGLQESGGTFAHDCAEDPELWVMGSKNRITVTGSCTEVNLVGSGNVVGIASVQKLVVSGDHAQVRVAVVDRITVSGNQNRVVWTKGLIKPRPRVEDRGKGNAITPAR
jgi:hypothetical protein